MKLDYLQEIRNVRSQKHYEALEKLFAANHLQDVREVDEQFLDMKEYGSQQLRITYIMNHVRVCGGAKVVIQQANKLVERGHEVTILCRYPAPDWIEVKANYVEVPWQMDFADAMPETDVIVCTVFDQLLECFTSQKAPLVFFEQGDSYLFEYSKLTPAQQNVLQKEWHLPVPVIAVSRALANVIQDHFHRRAHILHNALDPRYFFPRKNPDRQGRKPRILIVGQDQLKFKGIQDIFRALRIVRQTGRDFDVVWVTPEKPTMMFDGTLVINPSQQELGEIYRSCDIYVSGSYYESFSLPVLEAMTCGCAVVSTRNAGVQEYAIHEYNCLLADIGNPNSLAEQIIQLIDHPEKRSLLVENGYKTANNFGWNQTIEKLEGYLHHAITIWNRNIQRENEKSLLRIEVLPKDLSQQEVEKLINDMQTSMDEEWCLWLFENEVLPDQAIQQVKRIISNPFETIYKLQVLNKQDIPDHPLIRYENRLLKRGQLFTNAVNQGYRIPVCIENGSQRHFLPEWLSRVISWYEQKRFYEAAYYIKELFSNISFDEQAIAVKWLVLCLFEMESFSQAAKVLNDAIQSHRIYSDLYYLYARLSLFLNEYELGQVLFSIAEQIGDAGLYIEFFRDIRSISRMYLNEIKV